MPNALPKPPPKGPSKGFKETYEQVCALNGLYPIKGVINFLDDGILDVNADKISQFEDWKPIFEGLSSKHALRFVAVRSFCKDKVSGKYPVKKEHSKVPIVQTAYVIQNLVKSIGNTLRNTQFLTCLELQSISLAVTDVESLAKDLHQNRTIQHLSLQQCPIGDQGLQVISKALKNCLQVTSLNVSYCRLSWKGAELLVDLLRHQTIYRHTEVWRETLRDDVANLDAMGGLQRLTLNGNTELGNKGACVLAEVLREDLWLKAIDIQQCNVDDSGARAFLSSLKYNTTLFILDVRRNDIQDRDLLLRISQQLTFNSQGQTVQFKWLAVSNNGKKSGKLNGKSGKKRGIPWRVGARLSATRHYPSYAPGIPNVYLQCLPPLLAYSSSEETLLSGENRKPKPELGAALLKSSAANRIFNCVKEELTELKNMLQNEREARKDLQKRIIELSLENEKLRSESKRLESTGDRSAVLFDEDTLITIEATFTQFNNFLDMLRNTGYGSLVDASGITSARFLSRTPRSGGSLEKSNGSVQSNNAYHKLPVNGSESQERKQVEVPSRDNSRGDSSAYKGQISRDLSEQKCAEVEQPEHSAKSTGTASSSAYSNISTTSSPQESLSGIISKADDKF